MAGSLLNAIDLARLVTNSAAAYEALAAKLAAEPHHVLERCRKLERKNATSVNSVSTSPLGLGVGGPGEGALRFLGGSATG